jgi:DNA-binding NarL/FixJ family response regulator
MQGTKEKGLIRVFVFDENSLAAEYLLDKLCKDETIVARLYRPQLPLQSDNENTVFVLDSAGCELSIAKMVRNLKSQFPMSKVVIVGRQLPKHQVSRLIALGVQGFVKHYDVPTALAAAVHEVGSGRMWIESDLLQEYTQSSNAARHRPADLQGEDSLTLREGEVLELVKQRLSNKEIASILAIEVSTVKYHLSNIYGKLQLASRDQLWQSPGQELISECKAGNQLEHTRAPASLGTKRPVRKSEFEHLRPTGHASLAKVGERAC